MYHPGTDAINDYKQLLQEKNKVIEDMKYLISQKDSMIQGLMSQIKAGS